MLVKPKPSARWSVEKSSDDRQTRECKHIGGLCRYLPLRRLEKSPMVWESVRSRPTGRLALIILGLWPDWWKKTCFCYMPLLQKWTFLFYFCAFFFFFLNLAPMQCSKSVATSSSAPIHFLTRLLHRYVSHCCHGNNSSCTQVMQQAGLPLKLGI